MIATRATDTVAVFCYNNLVGGQDNWFFDGHSFIADELGTFTRGTIKKISLSRPGHRIGFPGAAA